MKLVPLLVLALLAASAAQAQPTTILFVGNSYTFGRLDPVLTYNAANVRDLTRPQGPLVVGSTSSTPKFSDVTGTNSYGPGMINPTTGVQGNSYSPHSQTNGWGGVPGIFKQFTVQAGLDYDVALSTRNAATLRGHFLNTANSTNWDLRGNIGSQKWDKMVLQEQSDEALGPQTVNGVPLGSNFPSIRAYVDLIEDWVHTGRPIQAGVMTDNANDTTYRERNMYYLGGTTAAGGPGGQYANEAACVAAGGTPTVGSSSGSCANNLLRTIPNNPNFSVATQIYLQQTWARPNLINAPGATTIDPATGSATYSGAPAPSYFSSLEAMTSEMTTAMLNVANYADDDGTEGIKGIIPVGQAFLTAVQAGVATRDMYAPDALTDGLIDLWFNDGTHASVAGSYLSALVLFQSLTGRNALSLGAGEQAAADLGIASDVAVQLQRVAQATVGPDLSAPTTVAAANPPANANGWNNANVTVTLTATDNVNGSGVKQIAFSTTGAQTGTGIVSGNSASLTINVEGTTTVKYFATDNAGNVETEKTLVVQLDKTSPSISGMPAAGCEIWPPNNKLVNVATVAAQDGLSGLSSFNAGVASSEAAAPGQPDTVTAGTGLAPRVISVRATRLGDGPGRTYTLSASATDRAGNATTAVATCVVPHDQGH